MALHNEMISAWYRYQEKEKGFKPTAFTGADAKAIKGIRLRIQKILIEPKDEDALGLWKTILTSLPKTDKWLSEQPLQVINSRFDQLIFKIKNARTIENELASIQQWDGK